MDDLQFDLAREKEILYVAVDALHKFLRLTGATVAGLTLVDRNLAQPAPAPGPYPAFLAVTSLQNLHR